MGGTVIRANFRSEGERPVDRPASPIPVTDRVRARCHAHGWQVRDALTGNCIECEIDGFTVRALISPAPLPVVVDETAIVDPELSEGEG
jgi:hypothetical protein